MNRVIFFFAILIFVGINLNVRAQLSGTYTIPGNFNTIADAIDSLNQVGVGSGGVIFNVAAGHTETSANVTISIVTNQPTALNNVVFQKSGAGLNPLITASPGVSASFDGIIKFSGADYITFDAIDLLDPSSNSGTTAAMEWGYALMRADTSNGSQYNVIKNCTITLQKIITLSIGIYIINRDTTGTVRNTGIPSGQNSFNKFYGNTISNVYKGIVAISTSTILQKDVDNEIGVNGQTANSVTNWGGSTVSAEGIRCEGQTNVKIINNIVNGGAGTSGSAAVLGIMATLFGSLPNAGNYEIAYNQVTISASSSSQAHSGIRALANGDTVRIHHNIVENCNIGQTTNAGNGILHDPVGNVNASYIHHNIIRNNTLSGTGVFTLLNTGAASGVINNLVISSNQIHGNQKSGVSGTLSCITTPDGSINCDSNQVYSNSIPNSSGTSASIIYGYFNSGNNPSVENVFYNQIYNLTTGGSNSSASSIVSGIRSNLSTSSTAVKEIKGNIVYGLAGVSGNLTTGGVIGIWSTAGASTLINTNKIYNLTNSGSSGTTAGCWVTSGVSISIRDNLINDLRAPNSGNANAVIGLNITSTTANSTISARDNSIYLRASGGSTFGSSGVSVTASATATTAALELMNNSIINVSSAGSTSGSTVSYRRSTTSLVNYALTSDSNNYYSGNPISPSNLIFFDGTNSDQTLAAYKLRVAPRDANSTSQQFKTLNLAINFEACNEIDTITVLIRDTIAPYSIVDSVVGLGGKGIKQALTLNNITDGVNYYIVVKHRNSIETWSKAGGEIFTEGILTYDFTTAPSKAFGNNEVLVDGKYSIYTGDVNQDGIVDLSDLIAIYNDAGSFVTGYVVTDLNCNSIVDLTDLLYAYNNSSIFVSVKRP